MHMKPIFQSSVKRRDIEGGRSAAAPWKLATCGPWHFRTPSAIRKRASAAGQEGLHITRVPSKTIVAKIAKADFSSNMLLDCANSNKSAVAERNASRCWGLHTEERTCPQVHSEKSDSFQH